MIAIIQGCGSNIASVQFALERLGKRSLLTTDIDVIRSASHVILPGVGNAKHAIEKLQKLKLIEIIRELKQPVLGICLGMQILYNYSKEGGIDCLGLIPGDIEHLPQHLNLTLPHMGWNQLQINQTNSLLIDGIKDGSYVYFVHSYAAPVNNSTVAVTNYGSTFSAMVQMNNFYGVQFHPERSGPTGEQILRNFINLV